MSVPGNYLGVWRRTLLRAPGIEDTSTEVYWLQTARVHADLRIPTVRPGYAGKSALAQLTRAELLGLTGQQGFVGITEVQGEICRWHRRADYQPPSGYDDVGRMQFETPDRCLEYGVEQEYFEVWERLPESRGEQLALRLERPGPHWLLRSGDCVMRVRPRTAELPTAANLTALAERAGDDTLRDWLDFEISFARIAADRRCIIERSTLPWLEALPMQTPRAPSARLC